ncbi:MAG: SLC13 family permease [Candidatus Ratteibacteria bacterium]|nr:SLC13 family permease [Candidatus Ratteibacteria bacterium]
MKTLILTIFFLSYIGIILKREWALWFVYGAVSILLLTKAIFLQQIPVFINWNVLGIFLGTTVISYLFAFSGIPSFWIEKILQKGFSIPVCCLLICVITGLISAFVENVATVLLMAPVAFEFIKKFKINPVPLFVGMAISSNLQGCATMVGDSPSLIMALETGMNFNDFFWMRGKPGIFFSVQVGAILGYLFLYMFFRGIETPPKDDSLKIKKVKSWFPLYLLGLFILSFAIGSLVFAGKYPFYPAFLGLGWGIVGITWQLIFHKEKMSLRRDVDWASFFLLLGLFILVGSLNKGGIIEDFSNKLSQLGNTPFVLYNVIVWFSVFVSGFVDNIPYTMAMISAVKVLTASLNLLIYPYVFGLLLGTCIGGNITPIGASANVVATGLLKQKGYSIKFTEFVKIGLPFTIISVIGSYLFNWFVWK